MREREREREREHERESMSREVWVECERRAHGEGGWRQGLDWGTEELRLARSQLWCHSNRPEATKQKNVHCVASAFSPLSPLVLSWDQ